MSSLFNDFDLIAMQSTAATSSCGTYRHTLGRRWANGGKTCTFIMLNPSTADGTDDDPTIRRCISFAKREGAMALNVVNLFMLRATDPRELRKHADPVGPFGLETLTETVTAAKKGGDLVIAAWGGHPLALKRERELDPDLMSGLHSFGITASGAPRHPLYLRSDTLLTPYTLRRAS
jgi:hypothetical protein